MSGATGYDVIVVGARCAGSPTAMLLARRGLSVLVVDRARFPSDTVSTHLVHPPGMEALRRWGLYERVVATGCPLIDTYVFDFGPFTLSGTPGVAYAPRRTVLDSLLVDAAAGAGAQVRERFAVTGLLVEDGRVTGIRGRSAGGRPVTERARVVVGADGVHSLVARIVRPQTYHWKPKLLSGYYSYWSGVPVGARWEGYERPGRLFAAWPTNDGLTLVFGAWPYREFEANRHDIEGNLLRTFDTAPEFGDRIRAGRREARIAGTAVPNFVRKPYGPSWALVGDAGYNRDFITAQGIQDAFRDAELCATALARGLGGEEPFDVAMGGYQAARDAQVLAMYEFTGELASLDPPPPEAQQLLAAMVGDQELMDGFARVNAGVTSPAEFFAPENVERILGMRTPVGTVEP